MNKKQRKESPGETVGFLFGANMNKTKTINWANFEEDMLDAIRNHFEGLKNSFDSDVEGLREDVGYIKEKLKARIDQLEEATETAKQCTNTLNAINKELKRMRGGDNGESRNDRF